MLTVALNNMSIHANHGLYGQEQIIGHAFEVDVAISVSVDANAPLPYLDYVLISNVVKDVFKSRELYLETLVQSIYLQLKLLFPQAALYKVCVRKTHPPVGLKTANAEVCYEGP